MNGAEIKFWKMEPLNYFYIHWAGDSRLAGATVTRFNWKRLLNIGTGMRVRGALVTPIKPSRDEVRIGCVDTVDEAFLTKHFKS